MKLEIELISLNSFRWMGRMLTNHEDGLRVIEVNSEYGSYCVLENGLSIGGLLPVLTDPATLGCVRALVCERHNTEKLWTRPNILNEWEAYNDNQLISIGKTEIETLIKALSL